MATQHPDNACPTFFSGQRFITAQEEIEECYRCFKELGVEEFMWDWEGKFVDEAVMDRLYTQYGDYFKQSQIGKDIFITFRIPNIWIESSHKLPRAFMNLLSAEQAAKTYGFHSPPLFEVILPMTTSATQLITLQKMFAKIAHATEDIFEANTDLRVVDVIPLFEEFEVMYHCKPILHEYTEFLEQDYKMKPSAMRVFTARSDTAMNAGFIPAKLAVKIAIQRYHEFGQEKGIEMYPWVGGGSLPFRGGLNPENIVPALEEYRGVSTLTVQSAFRYDYDMDLVKSAIQRMNKELPEYRLAYAKASEEDIVKLIELSHYAAGLYKPVVEGMAELINDIADKLPSHRERVQHIGLFGYSRGIGAVKLPRAIKFTGAFYSLGIPPELIAAGRTLKKAEEMGLLSLITLLCPYLRQDFEHAGHYLNRENLSLLAKKYPLLENVYEDITLVEKYLDAHIEPVKPHHIIHRNITSNIYQKLILGSDFAEDVLDAAEIRKSLG